MITTTDFTEWWNTWRKHVHVWATRGIESRKHGELVERLALEEANEFAAEVEKFFAGEPALAHHYKLLKGATGTRSKPVG